MANQASTPAARYRGAMAAAALGLGINLSLGAAKLAGGIIGDSFALVSDAINSLGDALTSVVILGALWYAQRPADPEHPYGHTRAEAVAASNVALLIIVSALYVGFEAISRWWHLHEIPANWTLWIAGGSAVIKEGLYRYKKTVAQKTGSAVILANAWDHRSDALCSFAVLVGLVVVRWGGAQFIWADEAAALIVVAIIVWSGVHLFRESVSNLLDAQADPELVQQIRDAAAAVPGVADVEKLWVRRTGIEYLADIHIEVDANMSVSDGHRIGHDVKDRLLQRFDTLRDVLVHLEPFPHPASGHQPR